MQIKPVSIIITNWLEAIGHSNFLPRKINLITLMPPCLNISRFTFLLISAILLSQLVVNAQEILDFGATDREEADRLQAVIVGLCKNRPVNEYFRLSASSNCRDAVRCVRNDFRGGHSLAAIRCPAGLVFDLDGQTCNWASQVSRRSHCGISAAGISRHNILENTIVEWHCH